MKLSQGITFLIIVLIGFSACQKKEEEPKPVPHSPYHECKMIGFVQQNAGGCKDSVSFLGSWGEISEMRSFNNCTGPGPGPIVVRSRSFAYVDDKIQVYDSLTKDKAILILQPGTMRILELHRDGPTAFQNDYYEYQPNGDLKRSYSNDLAELDTTWYYYTDGDMTMSVFISGTRKDTTWFSYYLDKKLPDNGLQTQMFIQAGNLYYQRYGDAFIIKNVHLLKSYTYRFDPTQTLYEYGTDAYGNITKVIHSENGSVVDSTVYRYMCLVE